MGIEDSVVEIKITGFSNSEKISLFTEWLLQHIDHLYAEILLPIPEGNSPASKVDDTAMTISELIEKGVPGKTRVHIIDSIDDKKLRLRNDVIYEGFVDGSVYINDRINGTTVLNEVYTFAIWKFIDNNNNDDDD